MRNVSVRCFLLAFVSASTCFGGEARSKRNPVVPSIDRQMESFVRQHDIAGAVTLVAHRGKIIHYSAVGLSDTSRMRLMKKSSIFAIGAMTQPIVATGIMILQDEGKLSINDEISDYIPGFANLKTRKGQALVRPITIRECLSHTSGLGGKQEFTGTLDEAVLQLTREPLVFQPRRNWRDSPGLNVAGRIIEIVSGESLQKFLKKRIFDPLGMSDTTFYPTSDQIGRVATVYQRKSGRLVPDYSTLVDLNRVQATNPSLGLISNTRDVFRFNQMVLNRGTFRGKRIVSSSGIGQMLKPQIGAETAGTLPGNSWGLGWCLVQAPQGITEMFSKGSYGHSGDYGTQAWTDPKTKTIYVLMIQRAHPGKDGMKIRETFQQVARQYLLLTPKTLKTAARTK